MPLELFHPITAAWFAERFGQPTQPQAEGWPAIRSGQHTLIAAPTGSGKTLAAFLTAIDDLVRQAVAGTLADQIQVVYVSPLRALSNDIHRNLQIPLAEICQRGAAAGPVASQLASLRVAVRTGDTPARERQALLRRPPHLLVTTPESLYLLLTAEKSREQLRSVRTVIVDEIHALARDKRGSHLALSLARLDALCPRPPLRIGLSATQRPLDEVARFLVGTPQVNGQGVPNCRIIDVGHLRELDLDLELPETPLSAVCSHEQWGEVYERLAQLIGAHRSTLIFVNTRRWAERLAHQLSTRLGTEAVASHHGSLSKELRHSAEQRLKSGQLRAIVATSSLELGIDVGYIDLVCQVGSPRSIAAFLQRVGRSGHALGLVPKGRLIPLTRDGLVECLALIRSVRGHRLDALRMPTAPRDILAQQIVAAVASQPCGEDELFQLCRSAWPFHDFPRAEFDRLLELLSEGVVPGQRRGAYLHRDRVARQLRPRRMARLAAITSGGAIPDTADFRVVTEDEQTVVGTVNEDFALESMAGDIFLLGNSSWRIRQVRGGDVVVSDARGAPATVPFWLGEAPGRTPELSSEVSRLRAEVAERVAAAAPKTRLAPIAEWLAGECGVTGSAAVQAVDYIAAQHNALGLVPTQQQVVFERFFDDSGGMQLVIHAPFGGEVNRAWGLAMRKRFCRSFNFELQAAADDNAIVLSLGPQHSFPLDDMFRMIGPQNAEYLLVQALLAAPMFLLRWRWNATRALAVLRYHAGRKVPPALQRFRADDLLSAIFPETTGCLENHVGDIELPRHPLVEQTVHDCLHEAMDLPRWLTVLEQIAAGQIALVARDTREPSPFAHEVLNANPYAFLDDAPLEERRARAVATRRSVAPESIDELAWLDPEAIALVRREAWPLVRDTDDLADLLLSTGVWPEEDGAAWAEHFQALVAAGRASVLTAASGQRFWVLAERLSLAQAAYPNGAWEPLLKLPDELLTAKEPHEAVLALVRGRVELAGPIRADELAELLALRPSAVEASLEALEGQGLVLRGQFTRRPSTAVALETKAQAASAMAVSDGQAANEGQAASDDVASRAAATPAARHSGPAAAERNCPPEGQSPSEGAMEWCDRRLLARIHRLTLSGARRLVEPVPREVFWQFLCEYQHALPGTRLTGPGGLATVLGQLGGCELPAGAWEVDVLPQRLADYDPAWLDDLALSGRAAWGRLAPPRRAVDAAPSTLALNRSLPIGIALRGDLPWLLAPDRPADVGQARAAAQAVYEALTRHGALFGEELVWASELLPAQVEDALGELVALGLATCDGFAPLRRLAADHRRAGGRSRRAVRSPRTGRWLKFPPLGPPTTESDRIERWAEVLLDRWGVVCRDLVEREPLAPPWWQCVRVFRRREMRGEIRGGRFVADLAGEQFARPGVIAPLRALRTSPPRQQMVVLSGVDPLNLTGVLTDGGRVPAQRTATLALCDGRLMATQVGGEVRLLAALPDETAVSLTRSLRQNGLARLRWEQLGQPAAASPGSLVG